jgi:hypothetical protein
MKTNLPILDLVINTARLPMIDTLVSRLTASPDPNERMRLRYSVLIYRLGLADTLDKGKKCSDVMNSKLGQAALIVIEAELVYLTQIIDSLD